MRTLFVGDVHGCSAELCDLLGKANFTSGLDRLLLTGDAFARGPDPLGVWQLICQHGAEMTLGNHDARLLQQLTSLLKKGKPGKTNADQRYALKALEPVYEELCLWLGKAPLYIREELFLLVHAGINPERGLEHTSFEEFITIRSWPPVKGRIDGPRWHDYYEKEYPLLVFGHDAPGGLVTKERDGHPYLLGLDSGCVYGHALSAYILEEQRLLEVKSRQAPNAWRKRGA
ncbi:MAG: hypothetical protein ACI906_005304 [Candidatus Latescibacterota bacterium]|jgi:hypothetical protein